MNVIKNSKVRESNIELLRIIAMFMVLLVHVDFFALKAPSVYDIQNNAVDSVLRVFFQSLSIACVDIFVFISGWFGIKPKLKGFLNFIFQCLFFLIGLYVVALFLGTAELSKEGLLGCIAATPLNWFIKAYLLLYIISPVLNAFVNNASKETFRNVLLGFYAFQFLYGWIFSQATDYINGGYSTISFMGLYLLARYVSIYKPSLFNVKPAFSFLIVSLVVSFVTFCYVVPPYIDFWHTGLGLSFLDYISPTTLLITVYMVQGFSKLKIHSSIINWIAASSFAVFLLHTNPNVLWHYVALFQGIHVHYPGVNYWVISIPVLILIFLIAVIIDQLRKIVWKQFWNFTEMKFIKEE